MLFNSLEFAVFLPLVFCLYWALQHRSRLGRNLLLLLASYLFYGWWDGRFLALIAASSAVDYWVGLRLHDTTRPRHRRLLLGISLAFNLGLLGTFKYFDFFVLSLQRALASLGFESHGPTLGVVLPVGISFYTFQTLSYTIDVYRRRMEPTRDPIAFFAFVSFFPQLVAGPIERAESLLPQFHRPTAFDSRAARDGLRQILWGLFKKVVIADNLAPEVDRLFDPQTDFGPATHWTGAFLFAIQIYCDFSGYSDIAIGTARLFGFQLTRNFAFPYFSRNIAEFWRRWHISLSSWFRDYVFIPLGGSRGSLALRLRNILIVFTLSGLWHGANWTFVIWGLLHALYYIPSMLMERHKRHTGDIEPARHLPRLTTLLQIASTFGMTLVAWVFFRAESLGQALHYLDGMFSLGVATAERIRPAYLAPSLLLLCVEWPQRHRRHALDIEHWPAAARWASYYALVLLIAFFGNIDHVPFIYFQF